MDPRALHDACTASFGAAIATFLVALVAWAVAMAGMVPDRGPDPMSLAILLGMVSTWLGVISLLLSQRLRDSGPHGPSDDDRPTVPGHAAK